MASFVRTPSQAASYLRKTLDNFVYNPALEAVVLGLPAALRDEAVSLVFGKLHLYPVAHPSYRASCLVAYVLLEDNAVLLLRDPFALDDAFDEQSAAAFCDAMRAAIVERGSFERLDSLNMPAALPPRLLFGGAAGGSLLAEQQGSFTWSVWNRHGQRQISF